VRIPTPALRSRLCHRRPGMTSSCDKTKNANAIHLQKWESAHNFWFILYTWMYSEHTGEWCECAFAFNHDWLLAVKVAEVKCGQGSLVNMS
jgi:hypothetical protein